MVRKLVGTVLDMLLIHRDLERAIAHVKAVISDLLLNRIDMSDLVVSKSLSQVRVTHCTGLLHRLACGARTCIRGQAHACMQCV
jgi:DNA polymerase delta subunit 1